jgi:diguanylate cyclase (GGDEF)-like protein
MMALFLLRYIRRNYIAPVSSLYWDLKTLREVGDLSFRMSVSGNDEFNQFRRGFNELLEVIEEQTVELTSRNLVLSEEANRDALTGLYNKRYFMSRMKTFSRRPGEGEGLSLIMMDIDHFKMYNDRYGHIAGDACIRSVASVLGRVVTRPSDLCARYGGEEFVILLDGTGQSGAEKVAARIMDQLSALKIENADSPVSSSLTVSMGIACGSPGSQDDLEVMLLKADRALYRSKEEGRNRFSIASDPD